MPKIGVATVDEALLAPPPAGISGGKTRALFGGPDHSIQVHLHELDDGEAMRFTPSATDRLLYVWSGSVEAGGRRLGPASSLIVERHAGLELHGADVATQLLSFGATRPKAQARSGGHVHLLPAERVPRTDSMATGGVPGALYADAACPTCEVWLHENTIPPMDDAAAAARGKSIVHAHAEDEVIFVTRGALRLGTRLLAAGAALSIEAETFYGFGPGPDGLEFLNFRAERPAGIRFKDGTVIDEVGLWRDCADGLSYLEPLSA